MNLFVRYDFDECHLFIVWFLKESSHTKLVKIGWSNLLVDCGNDSAYRTGCVSVCICMWRWRIVATWIELVFGATVTIADSYFVSDGYPLRQWKGWPLRKCMLDFGYFRLSQRHDWPSQQLLLSAKKRGWCLLLCGRCWNCHAA